MPAIPTSSEIKRAAAILRAGGLVAFPTQTVYGLGADAGNPAAVAKIFAAKGRPQNHPLIVHVGSVDLLSLWAREIPAAAHKLAADGACLDSAVITGPAAAALWRIREDGAGLSGRPPATNGHSSDAM